MDQRVTLLEEKCAYLEKTLGELSDVVWRQQKELDALKETYQQLRDRVAADPGLVDAAREDKPPHY